MAKSGSSRGFGMSPLYPHERTFMARPLRFRVAGLKATDIRALCEVSERASKMYELLEGRATDRTDSLTRDKLDKILAEMQKDLEERLARVPTIH